MSSCKKIMKLLQESLKSKDTELLSTWLLDNGMSPEETTNILIIYKQLIELGALRLSEFKIGKKINTRSGESWIVTAKKGETDNLFKPDLTPLSMFRIGVFGGVYTDGWEEDIPLEWTMMSVISRKMFYSSGVPLANVNFYGVISEQDINVWKEKGWLRDQDPKGWFQWYIRYHLGRRTDDDKRQKSRWMMFKRHVYQINLNPGQNRLKQRQACIQWAYNPDKQK
jgi:hypothetical protein